jgi:hypothetical protein
MIYSASHGFVLRRFTYAVGFLSIAVILQQVMRLSVVILILAVPAGVTTVIKLVSQIRHPIVQIDIRMLEGDVLVKHVGLLGGWRSSVVELSSVESVNQPRELGSSTAEEIGVPHLVRPIARLLDLYELEISASSTSYVVVGSRADLLDAQAIHRLRSLAASR